MLWGLRGYGFSEVWVKRGSTVITPEKEEPQNTQHTRGICVDYQYLHNPFPDEEDETNEAYSSNEELFAIIASDELTNLKDA
jgi:hypothetical protein